MKWIHAQRSEKVFTKIDVPSIIRFLSVWYNTKYTLTHTHIHTLKSTHIRIFMCFELVLHPIRHSTAYDCSVIDLPASHWKTAAAHQCRLIHICAYKYISIPLWIEQLTSYLTWVVSWPYLLWENYYTRWTLKNCITEILSNHVI